MYQFAFSFELGWLFASVQRTTMLNKDENADMKRTEEGINRATRTEERLTETLVDKLTKGEVEYDHIGRRKHCGFSFKWLFDRIKPRHCSRHQTLHRSVKRNVPGGLEVSNTIVDLKVIFCFLVYNCFPLRKAA